MSTPPQDLQDEMLEVGEARSPAIDAGRAVLHRRRQDAVAQAAEASVCDAANVACARITGGGRGEGDGSIRRRRRDYAFWSHLDP